MSMNSAKIKKKKRKFILLQLSLLNMPRVLNIPKFWIWPSSECGKVLNMLALHSVLNMPDYALTEFWT